MTYETAWEVLKAQVQELSANSQHKDFWNIVIQLINSDESLIEKAESGEQ